MEKQRTKELEEELRIIKLKLNTETQAKRDLQLQILRGNNAPASNGKAPPLTHLAFAHLHSFFFAFSHFRAVCRLGPGTAASGRSVRADVRHVERLPRPDR